MLTILKFLILTIGNQISQRCPDFKPRTMLDFGAGPAPSTVAALQLWQDCIQDVLCVDPSEHMTRLGKYVVGEYTVPHKIKWQSTFYDCDLRFDLIVVSYVQMDIRGQWSRDALLKRLWNHLNDDGLLVLIEPGTPTGFRFMHHSRELFINKLGLGRFHFVSSARSASS